jgi:hypothetical protein
VGVSLVMQGPSRVKMTLESQGIRHEFPLPERLDPRGWEGAAEAADGRWCVALPGIQVRSSGAAGRLTLCSQERWIGLDAVAIRRQH